MLALVLILALALAGCAHPHRNYTAQLIVPQKCVTKIELLEPVQLDKNGKAKPVKVRVTYHCTESREVK